MAIPAALPRHAFRGAAQQLRIADGSKYLHACAGAGPSRCGCMGELLKSWQ
jgi:hypothetical protein